MNAIVGVALVAAVLLGTLPSAFSQQRSREQCREMANDQALVGVGAGTRGARDRFMKRCMRGDPKPDGTKRGGMGGMRSG